jgi:hypothetical protein
LKIAKPPAASSKRGMRNIYETYGEDQQYVEERPSRFFAGFVTGVVATAIAAVALVILFGNASAIFTRPNSAVTPAVTVQPAPPPPSPAPAPNPSTSSPQAPVADPAPSSASVQARPPDRNAGSAAPVAATAKPGDEDLAAARRYLSDRSRPGDAVAAQSLWSAVGKGNVEAEILLADLYSRGRGVAKSCNQARVLLRAAGEKGSTEAWRQLARLARSGC